MSPPLHAEISVRDDFLWLRMMAGSFSNLKIRLSEPPVLAYPNFSKLFILEPDVSCFALEAILFQKDNEEKLQLLQCAKHKMNSVQKKLLCLRKDRFWQFYFFLKHIGTVSNRLNPSHSVRIIKLSNLHPEKNVHKRPARWLVLMVEYRFKILYRVGNSNNFDNHFSIQHIDNQLGKIIGHY